MYKLILKFHWGRTRHILEAGIESLVVKSSFIVIGCKFIRIQIRAAAYLNSPQWRKCFSFTLTVWSIEKLMNFPSSKKESTLKSSTFANFGRFTEALITTDSHERQDLCCLFGNTINHQQKCDHLELDRKSNLIKISPHHLCAIK